VLSKTSPEANDRRESARHRKRGGRRNRTDKQAKEERGGGRPIREVKESLVLDSGPGQGGGDKSTRRRRSGRGQTVNCEEMGILQGGREGGFGKGLGQTENGVSPQGIRVQHQIKG